MRNIKETRVDDLAVQDILNTSRRILYERLTVELKEGVRGHVFHHVTST